VLECDVHHRVLPVLLAASLMTYPAMESQAAVPAQAASPAAAASSAPARSEAPKAWLLSPELLVQSAGALVGIGAFSLFLAPQATVVADGVMSMLGDRIMATVMATTGAIGATYLYDLWTGLPIQYDYFWHRGGFVAGVATGVAVFGVLGYPISGGATWLGWTANRAALIGAGLYGAWVTDRWYSGR
jgi:hypothetical protein